jgi:two-component system cell cycle sensor histidine kinase/response regulator CckA
MAPPKQPSQLLIIDDHEDDRKQLAQLLRQGVPGVTLHEATDEDGLTEALRHTAFDVVVAEYRLGWSDGLRVLRTIKTHQPHAAVIWVSRAHLDEAIVLGMKEGLHDYVSKRRLHRLVDVIHASLAGQACAKAQKTALQTLHTSEQRYQVLAELTSDYAYILRIEAPERTFVEWVDARFTATTGYTLERLAVQDGWTHLLHPQDVPTALQRQLRWLAGQTDICELRLLTQSGEELWVREYTSPASVAGTTGSIRVYGAGQNIAQRRRLEAPLRQAQQMEALGRLAGGIAHDFNNVLQVVSGYSDMLLRRLKKRTLLRQYAQQIRDVAEQGAILTRQLVTLSRKPYPQPEVVEVEIVLERIAPVLRRLLGDDVELHLEVAPALGRIYTDPLQLEQVITTLAVEARDAMPQGGRLTVEVAKIALPLPGEEAGASPSTGGHLLLTISNTGSALDVGVPPPLFEPFFTRRRGGKGADLGLFTVYGIVNQIGGSMRVESVPGVGTTFTIYWPYVSPSDMAVDVAVTESTGATAGGETILLVEDEAIVRDLVCRVLQAAAYTVLEAADGEQALRLVQEQHGPIHLLVVDVVLPGISGPEVIKRLAATHPGLPVLYISGYAQETIERYDLPSNAFLQKPFTPTALLDRVREALKTSRMGPDSGPCPP